MKIKKLYNALRSGTLGILIHKKLHNFQYIHQRTFNVYNDNTRELVHYDNSYKKIEKEFRTYITNYVPERKEHNFQKIIWICWLQGYEKAPDFVKACINSIKKEAKGYEVIIITEKNMFQYVNIPVYIINKFHRGDITPTHFSDILRVSLLCEHGGIWIDSTVLCTDGSIFQMIEKHTLFVYKDLDLTRKAEKSILASSWLIGSFGYSSILQLTRDLLYRYWEKHDFLIDYFLFHLCFSLAVKKYRKEWDAIPMFENRAPHVLMFELSQKFSEERWKQICRISDIHKLTRHEYYGDDEATFYSYILREYRN